MYSQQASTCPTKRSLSKGGRFEVCKCSLAGEMAWQAQEQHYQHVLEQTYWAQQEAEYHQQLQEYYTLRQQHQLNQQRLNQVLYGCSISANQPSMQPSCCTAQLGTNLPPATDREPLQPLGQDKIPFNVQQWHKACAMEASQVQLIGRKRPSDSVEVAVGKRTR